MALEIKQSLKLSQQLVMTPQLQQAIKLLQLNRLELADVINQELMENPLLEEVAETLENPEGLADNASDREKEQAAETASQAESGLPAEQTPAEQTAKDEFDWENYIEEVNNNQSSLPSTRISAEDLPSFENVLTRSASLEEHLLWQLGMSTLADHEKKLGQAVIGNLNEDGYLVMPLEDIARESDIQLEDAEEILKIIQRFDPVGVGSRDVRECLLTQAELLNPRQEFVETIIKNHLPDLERKNYQAICRALNMDMPQVIEATRVLRELEPKPGRRFIAADNTQYITPDIYVTKGKTGEYIILLNEDGMPRLRVSNYYKSVMSSAKDGKDGGKVTKEYIQEKLRAAIWLLRSIHNRQKTIYKVTDSIVKHQRDFFDKGVSHLKPLVLKDVAGDIGVHESTVSRVTTNKYMHTPVGIFELKYFFNSGISASDGGDDVASEAVKEKIRLLVQKEDGRKPLSDQRIVELLKSENIDIARRTVAKYRDVLGILSSSKRKKPF